MGQPAGAASILDFMFLAIGLASWVGVARLTRGQFLALKQRDFVEAARSLGAGHLRIITHHLVPNSLGPLIVYLTFNVPRAIFAEAALSYIGIGDGLRDALDPRLSR